MKLVETHAQPYEKLKNYIKNPEYKNINLKKLIYLLDVREVYPIDLDLEENINQSHVRLRPEFVKTYIDQDQEDQVRLGGGSLTYAYEDEDGMRDDLNLAKASQNLKYKNIPAFVKYLDELKYVPLNSEHLAKIMKSYGINIRYLGMIFKLTSLPYLRQMLKVEAAAREIKKIFRDHQK